MTWQRTVLGSKAGDPLAQWSAGFLELVLFKIWHTLSRLSRVCEGGPQIAGRAGENGRWV